MTKFKDHPLFHFALEESLPDPLKPMFKWSGGKSRELPFINSILPAKFDMVIEPFIGGGAFTLFHQKPSLINDNDKSIVNFYEVVKDKELYSKLKVLVDATKKMGLPSNLSKEECRTNSGNLCHLYYQARDYINSPTPELDKVKWAYSFLVVRQLCFSGMFRQSSTGAFNVPYGWYKSFSSALTDKHHEYLQQSNITHGSFANAIPKNLTSDDFIFVDPPYLNRAGYNDVSGSTSITLHQELFDILDATKAKWMVVHCDDQFYRTTYQKYKIIDKDFMYSQNFRGRESKTASVSHLYIINY